MEHTCSVRISEESRKWSRSLLTHRNHIAVDGSSREVAEKYAACGWAEVQFDVDGGNEPWFAVYGTMPEELYVQRTVERAAVCALHRALSNSGARAQKRRSNLRWFEVGWDLKIKWMRSHRTDYVKESYDAA